MNFSFRLFIIVSLLPLMVSAQQRWYSSFGRLGERENSVCITESYDHGYLIAGNFFNAEGFVVKTGINGYLLWDKVYISGNLIVKFYANGVFSSGRKLLAGHSGPDPLIMSLDACGEVEWCHIIKNTENFIGGVFIDVNLFEDGHILALAIMGNIQEEATVYLFSFNSFGDLLWMKEYISTQEHPDLFYPFPSNLDTVGNDYFITGDCYYRLPDNPDVFALRPMFIKIDENFEEEWLLPYGHNISSNNILGTAKGVLSDEGSDYKGYGHYSSLGRNGILMDFSTDGYETDYIGIPNNSLDEGMTDNYMKSLKPIDDTLLMASTIVSYDHIGTIQMGEYIVTRVGNVYNYQYHPNTSPAFHPMIKTDNNQFVFAGKVKQDEEWDIFLYKLNADLSSAAPITDDTITYDYLCDNLPIVSDTIDLSTCGIITGTEEIPSPEAYYARHKTISMKVSPNPVSILLHLMIGDNNRQSATLLRFYHSSGKLVHEQLFETGNEQTEIDVSSWQKGMYIVLATDDTGRKGSVKFIVK